LATRERHPSKPSIQLREDFKRGRRPARGVQGDDHLAQAGYAYDVAFRQFEVSDTRMFDQPQAGRAFFEGVIRDHLDLGRPDQVVLIFDRRLTPRTTGRFRTKVVTAALLGCRSRRASVVRAGGRFSRDGRVPGQRRGELVPPVRAGVRGGLGFARFMRRVPRAGDPLARDAIISLGEGAHRGPAGSTNTPI
jgi:hypothetical protein